jgi:hypothetical protein
MVVFCPGLVMGPGEEGREGIGAFFVLELLLLLLESNLLGVWRYVKIAVRRDAV